MQNKLAKQKRRARAKKQVVVPGEVGSNPFSAVAIAERASIRNIETIPHHQSDCIGVEQETVDPKGGGEEDDDDDDDYDSHYDEYRMDASLSAVWGAKPPQDETSTPQEAQAVPAFALDTTPDFQQHVQEPAAAAGGS